MYRMTLDREERHQEPRPVSPKKISLLLVNCDIYCVTSLVIKIFPRSLLLHLASLVLPMSFRKVDASQNDTENTQIPHTTSEEFLERHHGTSILSLVIAHTLHCTETFSLLGIL